MKGMIFSPKMIVALKHGDKTQTRRHEPKEVGDRLWVRESLVNHHGFAQYEAHGKYEYPETVLVHREGRVQPLEWRWKPKKLNALFMPKEACRLELVVTAVRQEPLGSITEADAWAEGVQEPESFFPRQFRFDPVEAFRDIWKTIHGWDAWDPGQLVWVIEFQAWRKVMRRA